MDERATLTPRQKEVYNFMVAFFLSNDQLPTSREMQRHFGWQSQTAAIFHIRALNTKGWIEHNAVNRYKFTRPITEP